MRKKHKIVAGLDEVGRGSLAGPVVACAVSKRVSNFEFRISNLKLRDSKKLTPRARERFYEILTSHPDILWGIGLVSEKIIDKINILEATKLAMKKALQNLENKLTSQKSDRLFKKSKLKSKPKIGFLILDGKMKLDLPIRQLSIVKADEKIFSCMVASIIAKVTRDRIMKRYAKKYPQYGFDRHMGYPTQLHLAKLRKYGPSFIHRKSFAPVRKMVE